MDHRRPGSPHAGRSYRDDITGLRAIAVMAVLLFHLRIPGFEGGYVGVDVFFVISGFLITGILWRDLEAGTHSFPKFFLRRLRRLFPATLMTSAASLAMGALLFGPQPLAELAGSTIFTILGLSNIYFWTGTGYFGGDSSLKPLLHTWSLSVEWQLYVLWPFALGLAWRWRNTASPLLLITIVGVTSLLLNVAFTGVDNSSIFYLPWFRVFEFAIGAIVVWLIRWKTENSALRELVSVGGLCLIGYAVFSYTKQTVFPSVAALAPCVGTALLIWAQGSTATGRLLTTPIARWLGECSYSVYLVHWPLIVFFASWKATAAPSPLETAMLFVVSLVLGSALHRWIEKPFRDPRGEGKYPPWKFAAAMAVFSLVIIAPAVHARMDGGWAWRISGDIAAILHRAGAENDAQIAQYRNSRCFIDSAEKKYFRDFDFAQCMTPAKGKANVLLIGDSIAAYAWQGIQANAGSQINVMRNMLTGCVPLTGLASTPECGERNRDFLEHGDRYKADLVILMGHWRVEHEDALKATLDILRSRGSEVLVIGPTLRFDRPLYQVIASYKRVREALIGASGHIEAGLFELDATLRAIAKDRGAGYFSVLDRLCPKESRESCTTIIGGEVMVTSDTSHLLPSAAEYVFRNLDLSAASKFH